MIRKLLMVAAVAIVPVGAVVATGASAGALTPPTATAKCGTVTGTVSFSHPISTAGIMLAPGASSTQVTTIHATLGACTNTATGVTLTKGTVSGTISTTSKNTTSLPEKIDTCAGLAATNTITGSLTTVWTANHPTPSTVSKFTKETGGVAGGHGTFKLGPTGDLHGSGSFLGLNSGTTDASSAKTTLTTGAILALCAHPVPSLGITTNTAPAATFA